MTFLICAIRVFQVKTGCRVISAASSGFGVSASRFGARIGLALVDGEDLPETRLDLATTMPNWIPPEPFRYIGAHVTMYALDTLDEKGGWRHAWLRMVRALGFPVS